MGLKYNPYLANLVLDAALKSFWRKQALRNFLRNCNLSETYISNWAEGETKRDFLYRLFAALVKTKDGKDVIVRMADFLSVQEHFPDLTGFEDSKEKLRSAEAAVRLLKDYIRSERKEEVDEEKAATARKEFARIREEKIRSQNDLLAMKSRLENLATRLGSAEAGYAFQDWFYDLMDLFEITSRRPYNAMGRQIDGSLTIDGTTYLVELKFTSSQADAIDIDTFHKKVTTKADNTMGLMLSISGYSVVAIEEASRERTPLLLLDSNHLWPVLLGAHSFPDIVARVRRHASQTGRAYLAAVDFEI